MKPTIGLNCGLLDRDGRQRLEVYRDYTDAVERAGGVPVLLPVVRGRRIINAQLDRVDGLVLVGGSDYDPATYRAEQHPATKLIHPDRDVYDRTLARSALRRSLPVLGICGGHQLVNIARGGDLIQDVASLIGRRVIHRAKGEYPRHPVTIEPDTQLGKIIGARRLTVNSSHHQAVGRIGKELRVSARSADGVVEAIESTDDSFVVCVQWHPERLASRSARHLALFKALIQATRKKG